MTQRSETFATSVWCQAGRRSHRSPNFHWWQAAWRTFLVALVVAWLGLTLVSAFRSGIADVRKSLGSAQVVPTPGVACPMTAPNFG